MKQTQWVMVIGMVVGIGLVWSTNATAIDWFSRKPTTQSSVAPHLQDSQGRNQATVTNPMALVSEANVNIKEWDYLNSCTSTPTCANGYNLSTETCPNELPGTVPQGSPCYICTLPEKMTTIAKENLCLAENYFFYLFKNGSYICRSDNNKEGINYPVSPPSHYIQLCPPGMGAENFHTSEEYFVQPSNKTQYVKWKHEYNCRFAAATRETCNQCGSISMSNPSGKVYCVLPKNLTPADPNKPCK